MSNLTIDFLNALVLSFIIGLPIDIITSSLLGGAVYVLAKRNDYLPNCKFVILRYKYTCFMVAGVIISYFLSPIVSSYIMGNIEWASSINKNTLHCAVSFFIGYGWREVLEIVDRFLRKLGA